MGVTKIVRSGILFLTFFTASVYGQSLEISFTVSDSGEQRELTMGMDVDATEGYDPSFDQFAPPPPPPGSFDSRIKAGGEDYFRFYRPYTTDEVRYEVAWQIGQGILSMDWSQAELPEEGLVYISYQNGGDVVEVSLREGTEYTFDSFTSDSGQFELVIHLDGTEEPPVIDPPTIAITSGPASGAVIDTDQVNFSWEASSEESVITGYEVELLGPAEESFTTTETTYTFENLTDGEYSFRVRAQDEEEQFSGWAEREFIVSLVADPLPAPELETPDDGVVILADEPTIFSWSEVDGATGYEIQFDDDDPVSTGSDIQFELITSVTGVKTWRVRALANENPGEWSDRWSFTVEEDEDPLPVPETPDLVSPVNGASDVDRQPEFSWSESPYADTYDLQLSTENSFTNPVINETGLATNSFSPNDNLNWETDYFWRVRGVNESGPGEWSDPWIFTTPESPAVEGLELIEVDGSIELVWSISGDSDIVQFNIYRGSSPDQLNQYGTTSSEARFFVIQNIPQGATFYAVTYETSGGMESEYSNIVSFYNDTQSIDDQWNLVSVPLNHSEIELNGSQAFGFDRVYKRETILIPGKGYWVRSSSGESISFRSRGLEHISIQLSKGWNLIGGLAASIAVETIEDSSGILTTAPVYGYNGTNRIEITHLEPAKGYWIYAADEGEVSIDINNESYPQSPLIAGVKPLKNNNYLGKIIFSKDDSEQVIRTTRSKPDQEQLYQYLLPPAAPEPVLDVRTRTGYSLVDGESEELILETVSYPVGVRAVYEPGSEETIYRILAIDQDGNEIHINLIPGHQMVIDREYESLKLERIKRDEAILETKIEPNYPNPFNPVTNIRYRLSQSSEVYVDVYDVVGRRVARLVNKRQQPGQYTVNFDGSNLASGIYFLRFHAGDFVDIQKLTLIK